MTMTDRLDVWVRLGAAAVVSIYVADHSMNIASLREPQTSRRHLN